MNATEKKLTKKEIAKQEIKEAVEKIKKYLKPGDTAYTILRHVSKSGMMRHIDVYSICDNQPVLLSFYAAKVLERGRSEKSDGAIKCGGCGMDMGFELVYGMSQAVFGIDKGYAIKQSWL